MPRPKREEATTLYRLMKQARLEVIDHERSEEA